MVEDCGGCVDVVDVVLWKERDKKGIDVIAPEMRVWAEGRAECFKDEFGRGREGLVWSVEAKPKVAFGVRPDPMGPGRGVVGELRQLWDAVGRREVRKAPRRGRNCRLSNGKPRMRLLLHNKNRKWMPSLQCPSCKRQRKRSPCYPRPDNHNVILVPIHPNNNNNNTTRTQCTMRMSVGDNLAVE